VVVARYQQLLLNGLDVDFLQALIHINLRENLFQTAIRD
jgi:hypothetical protein